MDGTSPTARALLALELLQARPGITADQLGERLGVTERAARRYVAILREAGIPVESVRGPYGGYRVGRGLRLPPLMFSASEALGLVMAVLDGHPSADDPTDPVGSALGKIVRALPTGSVGSLASWCPSRTAITRPRASVALNIRGGSRRPRPTLYPPYGPRSDSIGMPASRRMPTYRRAARSETPSLSASRSAVIPGLPWTSSRVSSARAVGLAAGSTHSPLSGSTTSGTLTEATALVRQDRGALRPRWWDTGTPTIVRRGARHAAGPPELDR